MRRLLVVVACISAFGLIGCSDPIGTDSDLYFRATVVDVHPQATSSNSEGDGYFMATHTSVGVALQISGDSRARVGDLPALRIGFSGVNLPQGWTGRIPIGRLTAPDSARAGLGRRTVGVLQTFVAVSGEIVLESVTDDRVAGRFSFRANETGLSGPNGPFGPGVVEVTGVFAVSRGSMALAGAQTSDP